MSTTPRFDLIIEARHVLAGIPTKRYTHNLGAFFEKLSQNPHGNRYCPQGFEPKPDDCGTVACGAGWLSMYPPFKERGIQCAVFPFSYPTVQFKNAFTSFAAMAHLFNIPMVAAEYLFNSRRDIIDAQELAKLLALSPTAGYRNLADQCTDNPRYSEKQILLARFDSFIEAHNIKPLLHALVKMKIAARYAVARKAAA